MPPSSLLVACRSLTLIKSIVGCTEVKEWKIRSLPFVKFNAYLFPFILDFLQCEGVANEIHHTEKHSVVEARGCSGCTDPLALSLTLCSQYL